MPVAVGWVRIGRLERRVRFPALHWLRKLEEASQEVCEGLS